MQTLNKESSKVEFDYSKLRGRIKELCGTQDNFAERIGIGRVSLSQRLNNQLFFSQDEILSSCAVLNIGGEDIERYFFTPKV